jgi:acetylornithine aminotransferase/acetylornithine/N-succinyldiaminopimelate aminotransferase
MVPGFRHIPFNDLDAARAALSPATAAILIEGIQGEGGVTPATAEYLLGLRRLCDEKRLLLLVDAVQCGHYRTGRFQSFQRVLEGVPGGETFVPDGVSMAKSLGGGFPIGAFWLREEVHGVTLCDLLGPGTHGTTFGGTPLGCAVALKILEVIERDRLADHVRSTGDFLRNAINDLAERHPGVVKGARGLGFMLGIELQDAAGVRAFACADKAPSLVLVNRLHEAGVLTIPSGTQIVRLLPALNLPRNQAEEGMEIIGQVIRSLA